VIIFVIFVISLVNLKSGSMLPPDVANKIRSLLDTLDPLDLTDIANTCSGNALQFRRGDKDDCIRVILAYHSNPAELFARRKMKREYLIKYLWTCNIPVSLSLSKTEAVVRLLQHWDIRDSQQLPPQQQQQQALGQGAATARPRQPQLAQQQQNQCLQQRHQPQSQVAAATDDSRQPPTSDSEDPQVRDFLSGLSRAFAEFFFSAYHSPDGLPAAAFETNCDFVVELGGPAMPSACPVHRERHQSASLAAKGLLELCQIHGYCLQPNLVNGLSAELSSFGLVRLSCDCSLHHGRGGGCIGLARLHCLLAPRLTDGASTASSNGAKQDCYAIRGLRLLLYLEAGGVPACLTASLPPVEQRAAIQN
ncbi:hypothetical protein BOX15_Mlig009975g1, partial [Macrostomum lignano]